MAPLAQGSPLERLEHELSRRPRTWVVTGAAGFIGSHLVERLLALGQTVRAFDDLSCGTSARLEAAAHAAGAAGAARLDFARLDVREPTRVERASRGADYLLHQAGLGSVPRSFEEPGRSVSVNVEGTWSVLVAARAAGVARAVLASSSSVYGDCAALPQREERIGSPLSPYAAAKRAAELVAAGLSRASGFPTVALRYFNVFGRRQDPHGPYAAVVARWCAALVAGAPVRLEGDGRQTRDFTPVEHVVTANLLAATRTLPDPAAVINVGTGRELALVELLTRLLALGRDLGLEGAERAVLRVPGRPGDRSSSRADLGRARAWLGLEEAPELEPCLRALLEQLVDSRPRAS